MRNRIREFREKMGISQGKLTEACGVSRQTINAIENNKHDPGLKLAFGENTGRHDGGTVFSGERGKGWAMNKLGTLTAVPLFLVFLLISGFALYKRIRYGTADAAGIFFGFLALSYFFQWLNRGRHEQNGEKDEPGRHIETQSAKIGYYVLMILSASILFISEGTFSFNEIDNYPLLIVVGLTFVTVPITGFIYSRKLD